MRSFAPFLAAVPLVFAVAACQVTTDSNNDSVEVAYNDEVADNAVADAQNMAQDAAVGASNLAADIGNDVEREADKVNDKIVKDDAPTTTNAN